MDTIMLKDRPIFNTSPLKEHHIKTMLLNIIDDLTIVKKILKNTEIEIDEYTVQIMHACNEWDDISDMFNDIPNIRNMRTWNNNQIEKDAISDNLPAENESWEKYTTDHIPFTKEQTIKHFEIALKRLIELYITGDLTNDKTRDCISGAYNSQAFCMIMQPLLKYPQLANEYHKELKISRKNRKRNPNPKEI